MEIVGRGLGAVGAEGGVLDDAVRVDRIGVGGALMPGSFVARRIVPWPLNQTLSE